MMRSMYSAVSGLKTHQTKMDVIGNNIANVNTVAFKSSSVTFRDILYQTTSSASGANVATGVGGVNAKQIGLGVSMASTSVSIETAGASETTGNPFDIKLTDKNSTNFFVVSDGTQNLFTRAGSFYVDGAGNLCMTSTGYTVMGWQVDETTGEIRKDTVSALRVMQERNLTSAPEATENAVMAGVLDENDADVKSESGKVMNLNFYDDLGYQYTAKFSLRDTDEAGKYKVSLTSILDSNNVDLLEGMSAEEIAEIFGASTEDTTTTPPTVIVDTQVVKAFSSSDLQSGFKMTDNGSITNEDGTVTYTYNSTTKEFEDGNGTSVKMTDVFNVSESLVDYLGLETDKSKVNSDYALVVEQDANGDWSYTVTKKTPSYDLVFNTANGVFESINNDPAAVTLKLGDAVGAGKINENGNFKNISIDFTQCLNYNNSGKSTIGMDSGAVDGTTGKGRKLGNMIGISIDTSGKIFGSYDNGNTELLGQIAVAQFSNASGLEKVGESCYQTTLNSGEFDGIGVEVSADGSSMTTGELEMSNVDLSTEFTQMITTQRGFQANSRVITTSDTLLEELVNLKR